MFPTIKTAIKTTFQTWNFDIRGIKSWQGRLFKHQITYRDPDPLSYPAPLSVTAPASLFCGNVAQEIILIFFFFIKKWCLIWQHIGLMLKDTPASYCPIGSELLIVLYNTDMNDSSENWWKVGYVRKNMNYRIKF